VGTRCAGRLQTAAVELFVDQGFAATTVPQIAARAGLSTRTFFRHYADKRDVLFAGEEELPEVVAQVFAHAAPDLGPLDVVVHGLQTVVAPRLQAHHAELRIRRDIVRSDAALLERDASKLASLGRAATAGFADRGLSPLHAGTAGAQPVARRRRHTNVRRHHRHSTGRGGSHCDPPADRHPDRIRSLTGPRHRDSGQCLQRASAASGYHIRPLSRVVRRAGAMSWAFSWRCPSSTRWAGGGGRLWVGTDRY